MNDILKAIVNPLGAAPGLSNLNQALFGNKVANTIDQLPLDAIIAPVSGAMAATGPRSAKLAAKGTNFLSGGQQNVPAWLDAWNQWNTHLQPKPATTTSQPGSGPLF